MLSFLTYLLCFSLLFVIVKQEYKIVNFILIIFISFQTILSYYMNTGKIQDILYYLTFLSIIDLFIVASVIINTIIIKDCNIFSSLFVLLTAIATFLCIFDYYTFYYFQYVPMFLMEYCYFTIKPKKEYTNIYYVLSLTLLVFHII